MAKKDVMEYYDVVANQYLEMQEALKDMEEELQNNLISPDRVEQLKQTIEPIKTNYMRISYIVFLLNKPSKLRIAISKVLNSIGISTKLSKFTHKIDGNDLKAIEKENKDIIDNLKL